MSDWFWFILLEIALSVFFIGLLMGGLALTGVDVFKKPRELCKYCSLYHGGCMAPFDETIGCPYNNEKGVKRR